MFDSGYSKELYGLHGKGEILVAKVGLSPRSRPIPTAR